METNNQKTLINLSRLPIPTLKETAERYKNCLLPLLSTSDYNRAANVVDEFMKEVLQGKIIRYNRVPLLINYNWWIEFNDPVTGILENPPKKVKYPSFKSIELLAKYVDI
ncbi:7499_t:CDS:2 [Dentiscutata heterogama]|uniref:7499_t:CDS:1 n=1 Tax=Dentiscutata heterogama TaxID=1316150 RepID=A0ACA9KTJ4_9GLOM|nr:7499_t:CDS:2 [Dentiscutata heterogama]